MTIAARSVAIDNFIKGYAFDVGQGVTRDCSKAIFHYRRAAKAGELSSLFNLGQLYYERGKKTDLRKAVFWWSKAAKQGDMEAQCNLGKSFENGEGAKKNIRQALKYYRLAATQGDTIAQFNIARLAAVAGSIKLAQKQFKSIILALTKLSLAGDPSAQCSLAYCCFNGWGVKVNKPLAVKWYKMAAKLGNLNAIVGLGECYKNGNGVRQDLKKAQYFFTLASRYGSNIRRLELVQGFSKKLIR